MLGSSRAEPHSAASDEEVNAVSLPHGRGWSDQRLCLVDLATLEQNLGEEGRAEGLKVRRVVERVTGERLEIFLGREKLSAFDAEPTSVEVQTGGSQEVTVSSCGTDARLEGRGRRLDLTGDRERQQRSNAVQAFTGLFERAARQRALGEVDRARTRHAALRFHH